MNIKYWNIGVSCFSSVFNNVKSKSCLLPCWCVSPLYNMAWHLYTVSLTSTNSAIQKAFQQRLSKGAWVTEDVLYTALQWMEFPQYSAWRFIISKSSLGMSTLHPCCSWAHPTYLFLLACDQSGNVAGKYSYGASLCRHSWDISNQVPDSSCGGCHWRVLTITILGLMYMKGSEVYSRVGVPGSGRDRM